MIFISNKLSCTILALVALVVAGFAAPRWIYSLDSSALVDDPLAAGAVSPGGSLVASNSSTTFDPAALGIIKADGGTESVTFDQGAINYSEDPNAAGKIVNSTGATITDFAIRIKAIGQNCNPPILQKVTIAGVDSTTPQPEVHLNGISLSSGSDNAPISIKLGSVAAPHCDEFKLAFTPSVSVAPAASAHQDALGKFLFSPTQYSITRRIADPYNVGLHCVASHLAEEDSEVDLISLSGLVTFDTADQLSIADVFLRTESGGSYVNVSGASISVQGASFSITGFALAPGAEYHVVVLYTGSPTKAVELKLNAGFTGD